MQAPAEVEFTRCLEPLNALPFVQAVKTRFTPHAADCGVDAEVKVITARRTFNLAAVFKRSYLDRLGVNGLIGQEVHVRDQLKTSLLLVARYIPPPTGERLAQAGINFVDAVGNLHLNLGGQYYVFIVGRKEQKPSLAERKTTATLVQVVFTFLVHENAGNWSVRKLAEIAGVGKTAAADARQRLTESGMLEEGETGLRIRDRRALEEDFLASYERVLRPNLWLGAFRPLENDPYIPLRTIKGWADRNKTTWAVTGGQAAFLLNHSKRSERITVFLAGLPNHLDRELRLSADREGSVTLLRSFGTLFPWRTQAGAPISHPLLIYAELLQEGESKALEAAARIRAKYLAK